MSKYIKLDTAIEHTNQLYHAYEVEAWLESLPTIEVSEGNQVLYGTDHNCILTMFEECSYNETGCGDCAVAEKIRKALEVSEDCVSKRYLLAEIDDLADEFSEVDENGLHSERWCGIMDSKWVIKNAPSVVPTVRKTRTTAESQTCITEDRDTQILDAWQVHHRNITTVEGEPTTEQSSMVGEWQITNAYPHNVYCSECHKKFAQTHWAVWEDGSLPRNYCPHCGAKMKGADE